MARPRRVQTNAHNSNNTSTDKNSSSSNGSDARGRKKKRFNILEHWKQIIGCLVLGIAVCFGYMGYLETRVNTPFDDKKMVIHNGLDEPDQFWGTYRPGAYFGLKTKDPHSLVTGLMWYFPRRLKPGGDGIRHWCEQSDNLDRYGWLQHDGTNFGIQEIIESPFSIKTTFVKQFGGTNGGEWTARIAVNFTEYGRPLPYEEVSLIWYVALDTQEKSVIGPSNSASKLTGMKGQTPGLGKFVIKLNNYSGIIENESYLSTVAPGLHLLRETVISSLRLYQENPSSPKRVVLAGELLHDSEGAKKNPNFVATQVTGKVPFVLEVAFQSASFKNREKSLISKAFNRALNWHQSRFNQRFENTFHLKQKGYDESYIKFAQAALSNMVGGIGYFYGTSKVQSMYTTEPVHYWRAPLFTAVPSRSFFPRGFLWDEGFHGLLIGAWDLDLELEIMAHWFDLMNAEGWIPREQILGVEALAKVPAEFVVQRNTNANPPTFFITLQIFLNRYRDKLMDGRLAILERLYPRLQAWFNWFNTTQKGVAYGAYRWRGRDEKSIHELNPKTLTSGLDDYPRASHPSDLERHVDLYCWITVAADTMAKLSRMLGRDSLKYQQTADYLKNNKLLDELHWSEYAKIYADFGYHTDSVLLKRPKPLPRSQNQNMEMIRVTLKNPEYRLVDSTFGYVSLFPFLLQILDADSPKLEVILANIRNPDLLWTNFGLRSLSKNAPLYMKRNTEHDPPYWRGQIWININYLAIRALHFYGNTRGPYKDTAFRLYHELRTNVVDNLIKQYYRSGYIWEQYNDSTGEGSGCKPFTGWSALVVSIMSESY